MDDNLVINTDDKSCKDEDEDEDEQNTSDANNRSTIGGIAAQMNAEHQSQQQQQRAHSEDEDEEEEDAEDIEQQINHSQNEQAPPKTHYLIGDRDNEHMGAAGALLGLGQS